MLFDSQVAIVSALSLSFFSLECCPFSFLFSLLFLVFILEFCCLNVCVLASMIPKYSCCFWIYDRYLICGLIFDSGLHPE